MAFLRLTIAALVLASALVIGVAQAEPIVPALVGDTNSGRVGISTGTVWLPPAESYAYLQRTREAGITWVREDFTWSTIESRRGHYDWRRTDTLMRSTARLGLNVLAVVLASPSWASGHADSGRYPPINPADYARFVRAVALRYGSGGTFWRFSPRLRQRPLTAIEIWNEPWLAYFWQPAPDAGAYARLVRLAATAIKSVRPDMDVLASGDIFQITADGYDQGLDWLKPLLAADRSLWRSGLVDAWSVHPYCQRLSPWDTTAPKRTRFDRVELTRSLSLAAGARLPIWITEFGWTTSPAKSYSVSEDVQAQYEVEAIRRAVGQWGSFVTRSFVYTLNTPSVEQGYNLLRPDGSASPALVAIETLLNARR